MVRGGVGKKLIIILVAHRDSPPVHIIKISLIFFGVSGIFRIFAFNYGSVRKDNRVTDSSHSE